MGRGQRRSGDTGGGPTSPCLPICHAQIDVQISRTATPAAHLVAEAPVEAHNHLILLPRPLPPLDVGVQVVVPPAAWQGMERVSAAGAEPSGTASSQRQTHTREAMRSLGRWSGAAGAHRSRHCLPMRPGRCSAIIVHFWGPCSVTSLRQHVATGGGSASRVGGVGPAGAASAGWKRSGHAAAAAG